MNRHDRRKARKLSRDATPDEIFPPDRPHSGIQPTIRDAMIEAMGILRDGFPGFEITLFLAEKHGTAPDDRLPRFNYASTAHRADMLAVLEAFVAKNRGDADKLDKIEDAPPTARRQ